MGFLYNGLLLSSQNEETMTQAVPWIHFINVIFYGHIKMKCLAQANSEREKADQWCPGAGGGKEEQRLLLMGTDLIWGDELFQGLVTALAVPFCEYINSNQAICFKRTILIFK